MNKKIVSILLFQTRVDRTKFCGNQNKQKFQQIREIMNLFNFKDLKTVQDVVVEYSPAVKNNSLPLVIDNGLYFNF